MKHISEKPSENVILKDKILNAFLIRLGIRQKISSFSLLFNVLLILLTALMTRKESKIIKIDKRNWDARIMYMNNTKESVRSNTK